MFLDQVTGATRTDCLDWLGTQPLRLDLGQIRVVRACWHAPSIEVVTRELAGDRLPLRSGTPEHTDDWTDYTACVDFSAVNGGR